MKRRNHGAPKPRSSHRRWPRVFVAAALTAGMAACFGDIIIERQPLDAEEPQPGADVLPLAPSCEPGAVQCNGRWLEVCGVRSSNGEPEWSKRQDCLSAALCQDNPGRCVEPECRAGERRCSGAVPETCNTDLDGYDPAAGCVNAAHCSLDEAKCSAENKVAPCCLDVPCEPGELRCNGSEMQRCRADQTDLDAIATCATLELCELSRPDCGPDQAACACEPPRCEAGATRCTGTTLERCNAGQTDWELVQECVTNELCEIGRSLVPVACGPVACTPGEYNCDGETLEQCNAGQSDFDLVTACTGGPGFCNEALGICSQCEVGDTRCDLAQIQTCRADRSGFDPVPGRVCATPQLCDLDESNAAFCVDPACEVDEFDCDGAQLRLCNVGRTAFEPFGPACDSAALCSETRERCDACVPNQPRCNANRTSSQACSAEGNLGAISACPLGCIPETGACRTCTIGSYRCNGGTLSRCNDGLSFTSLNRGADCSGATRVSCNANTVQNTPCGNFGCNTTRNACNDCSAAVPASCAAGLTCNAAGLCRCAPNALICNDDALLVCNGAGTVASAAPRCSGGTDSNVLRTCDEGVLAQDNCGSGELCAASSGAVCAVCVPDELTCASGALALCNATGTGTTPAAACAGATRRTCQGATVVERNCESNQHCLASVGSACAVCLESDPPSCTAEGLEQRCEGGELVQSECLDGAVCVEEVGCTLPGL